MDEFGRLPDDILKYITFLGATPEITFDNPYLRITSPFITFQLKLFTDYEKEYTMNPVRKTWYREEKEHIDNMMKDITQFNNEDKNICKLYLSGYHDPDMNFISTFAYIEINDNKIHIKYTNEYGNEDDNVITLPIFLLPTLKEKLMEYIDFYNNKSYYDAINYNY
jgi:hypothetical protein